MRRFSCLVLLLCLVGLPLSAQARPHPQASTQTRVSASLREVTNLKAFTKAVPIKPARKKLLARNQFACSPTDAQQLFHIYEQNDYLNVPSFVTSDLVLQVYHIFYDFTLRQVESEGLYPALEKLSGGMLKAAVNDYNEAADDNLRAAALKNVAYFAVADRQLGGKAELPEEALPLVRAELALIAAHGGFAQGQVFPYKLDYSQFVPRGHYTRTEKLRRFFGAMMWYGLAPFALDTATPGAKVSADTVVRQSLLWVQNLYRTGLIAEWNRIYEPTGFYVGFADDLTPAEWKKALDSVYGAGASNSEFADTSKLRQFVAAARKLRQPRIVPNFGRLHGVPAGTPRMIEPPLPGSVQVRFMGQRYIPDSEMLQRLVKPVERVFPSGLDVMSVLGSDRARAILDASPRLYGSDLIWYKPERAKLIREFAALPAGTWTSNLYWGWLHTLRALLGNAPANAPTFMQGDPWRDKSLHTALGSWAELRHDTILYGKQSVVECGGEGREVPFVKGYVEPNVELWSRLLKLTTQSRQGLTKRALLSNELKDRFEQFEDLLTLLKRISEKELRREKLTQSEYEEIRYIGGKIEHLTLSVMEGQTNSWEMVSETDKNMAVIADVHTGGDRVLEEGVGHPYEILVIVPVEGKLVLTRGATFSYYEFKHPIGDRLTDEKWQAMLKAKRAPLPPPWTNSFLAPDATRVNPNELEGYDSGC